MFNISTVSSRGINNLSVKVPDPRPPAFCISFKLSYILLYMVVNCGLSNSNFIKPSATSGLLKAYSHPLKLRFHMSASVTVLATPKKPRFAFLPKVIGEL